MNGSLGVSPGHRLISIGVNSLRSSLYTNAFFLMASTVVTGLLGFVFWTLLAHRFPAGEVGIGSALISASGLVAALANLGMGAGLIRFVPEAKANVSRLLNSAVCVVALAGVVLAGVYLAGVGYWTHRLLFLRQNYLLAGAFIVLSAASAVSTLVNQAVIAGRKNELTVIKGVISDGLKTPLALFLLSSLGGVGIFLASGLGIIIAVFVALFYLLKRAFTLYKPAIQLDVSVLRPMFVFSAANYLAGFFSTATGYVLPLLILQVIGPRENAYFYVAWMLNSIIGVPGSALTNSLFAEGSHEPGYFFVHFRRAMASAFVILLIGIGLAELLAPWLLGLFGHEYSTQGVRLLRILVLGNFPNTFNMLFITVNRITKRAYLIVLQVAANSIVILSASYWSVRHFGLVGAGISYTGGSLLIALAVMLPLGRFLAAQAKVQGDLTEQEGG